ncbi:MAG: hypothetical protein WCL32_24470 [Planctomycetota bacterium]|jgi:hypothetical protein
MSSISALTSVSSARPQNLFAPASRGALGGSASFGKILDAQLSQPNATAPSGAASGPSDVQLLQALSQGSNLIGKNVVYSKNGGDATARGTVQGLRVEAGRIQLVIGGNSVPLDRVRSLGA